jgi:DNA-binding IclR family transcriptional regulator
VDASDTPTYPISSVNNALRLLLMFRDLESLRVTDASEALGVGRSTAHRLLAMLQLHGFVERDPETRAYRSGPALIDIGLTAVRDLDIRSHVRPHLERLSEEVQETVHLTILQGAESLFLDAVESPQALRVASRVGMRAPAQLTSGGKALLAELPPLRIRELFPSPRLEGRTSRSTKTRSALEAELGQVREQGYAYNGGELEPEIAGVAAVVRAGSGRARAAIAVSAPLARMDAKQAAVVAEAVKRAARAAAVGLA